MAPRRVYYHIRNESPVQVRCIIQGAQGWCTGITQKDGIGREVGGGFRMRTYVHPWQIKVNVWQNQYNSVKFKNKIKKKQNQKHVVVNSD